MSDLNRQSVFDDEREVLRRFGVAVREALLDHKRAGNSVAVWQDGKVVIVPPDEIEISELGSPAPGSGQKKAE